MATGITVCCSPEDGAKDRVMQVLRPQFIHFVLQENNALCLRLGSREPIHNDAVPGVTSNKRRRRKEGGARGEEAEERSSNSSAVKGESAAASREAYLYLGSNSASNTANTTSRSPIRRPWSFSALNSGLHQGPKGDKVTQCRCRITACTTYE